MFLSAPLSIRLRDASLARYLMCSMRDASMLSPCLMLMKTGSLKNTSSTGLLAFKLDSPEGLWGRLSVGIGFPFISDPGYPECPVERECSLRKRYFFLKSGSCLRMRLDG